jgi:hypothetical protein
MRVVEIPVLQSRPDRYRLHKAPVSQVLTGAFSLLGLNQGLNSVGIVGPGSRPKEKSYFRSSSLLGLAPASLRLVWWRASVFGMSPSVHILADAAGYLKHGSG